MEISRYPSSDKFSSSDKLTSSEGESFDELLQFFETAYFSTVKDEEDIGFECGNNNNNNNNSTTSKNCQSYTNCSKLPDWNLSNNLSVAVDTLYLSWNSNQTECSTSNLICQSIPSVKTVDHWTPECVPVINNNNNSTCNINSDYLTSVNLVNNNSSSSTDNNSAYWTSASDIDSTQCDTPQELPTNSWTHADPSSHLRVLNFKASPDCWSSDSLSPIIPNVDNFYQTNVENLFHKNVVESFNPFDDSESNDCRQVFDDSSQNCWTPLRPNFRTNLRQVSTVFPIQDNTAIIRCQFRQLSMNIF